MGQEVKRLVRRCDRRVVAGVAAGLGDYFGVDPIWFRVAFIVTTFLGGVGIIAYVAMWLLLPKHTDTRPTQLQGRVQEFASSFRGTPSWVGVALVFLGGALVISAATHWHPAIFWGVGLILVGVALFNRHETDATPPSREHHAISEPAPTPAIASSSDAVTVEQPRAISVRSRRERSGLGWLTIGAAMIALGVAALLDVANVVNISLVQYLAIPLTILGLGMIVGAFYGRARWLFVPALLLTPFVLAASLVHVPFKGGSGDITFRPTTVAAVRPVYHLTAGQLTLDLRSLKLTEPISIRATTVAGHLLVLVPPNTTVDIRGRAGGGEVDLFGRKWDGFYVDVRRSFGPVTPRVLSLDLEASLGQVEVRSN
ncbi:MAG TPA: PspC domain-containing protein [Actinomycetota bacterium]|nr:PspC domain-containing protein [Actinomycetota bacterium]